MKKIILFIILIAIAIVGSFFWLNRYIYLQKQGDGGVQKDYKNIGYIIEGQTVELINGYSEMEVIPGSASKIVTKYFGNEATGDLNGDGISDIAFLLTQEGGGSGTFYYMVAGIKTDMGYQGTNGILLGDRIAPQSTQISQGEILVNYADRRFGEPMTTNPSVGVSRYFKVEGLVLVEQIDSAMFGNSVDFVVNQKVRFNDGLTVSLKEIQDSRCKPGMVCIWSGELAPLFSITGGNIGDSTKEVRLGPVRTNKITESGYVFELKSATETTATITVSREITNMGRCYIGGCSSQICSSQEGVISTCEYKEAYACYKTAKCERQTNGVCGWTNTQELTECLNNAN